MIIEGNVVEISGSVGVGMAPDHGSDPDALVQHADIALYSANMAGSRLTACSNPLMEAIQRRRSLGILAPRVDAQRVQDRLSAGLLLGP